MFKKATIAAAVAASALVALPTAAQAQYGYGDRYEQRYDDRYANRGYGDRYQDRRYEDRRYQDRRYNDDRYYGRTNSNNRCSGTTGTIVGGVGGALAGRAIDRSSGSRYSRRGSGTTGAIIGGAIGALVGRSVDKSSCNNSRYYR
jgi:hypothetical protein